MSGHSITSGINIEKFQSEVTSIMYGHDWRKTAAGQEVLELSFPKTLENTTVKVVFEKPTSAQKLPIIDIADISKLTALPPVSMISKAQEVLYQVSRNANLHATRARAVYSKEPWGVHIGNFAFVAQAALSAFLMIYNTKKFAKDLDHLLDWIQKEAQDKACKNWLEDILLNKPGIMIRTFSAFPSLSMTIQGLSHLAGERYVDDDTVWGIMTIFSKHYGSDGQYLFIPPLTIEGWRGIDGVMGDVGADWDWEIEHVRSGRVKKAFAIVHMAMHWGAISIDLTRKSIQFGDSLGRAMPAGALNGIKQWLKHGGQDINQWSLDINRFDVPNQPYTSGSCAINAANTIERVVNPTIERWTHTRSSYHRLRYLRLLTGYPMVRVNINWICH